jgi:electron transport complex protein RnfC
MKTPLAFPGGLAFQPQAQLSSAPFARVPVPELLHVPLMADGEISPLMEGELLGRGMATLTDGRAVPAFILRAGASAKSPPLDAPASEEASLSELRCAGVGAGRRTSPDLAAQLASVAEHPVEVIVCNLVDHEPPTALGAAVLWHDTPAVLAAAQWLRKHCDAQRIILAVNHAVDPLAETLRRRAEPAGIELVFLPERYPQAHPTLLLYSLLEARLRPGALPTQAGALVVDGPVLLAIGQYLLRRQRVVEVPVALHDHTAGRLHYLLAAPGTPVRHLLRTIDAPAAPLILHAGDLMARRECSMDAVLSATSELVLHVSHTQDEAVIPSACVRSGWCIEYCPTQVQPAALLEAAQRQDMTLAEDAGLHACIDCGICSYVCPSDLPLAAAIRTLGKDAHVRG